MCAPSAPRCSRRSTHKYSPRSRNPPSQTRSNSSFARRSNHGIHPALSFTKLVSQSNDLILPNSGPSLLLSSTTRSKRLAKLAASVGVDEDKFLDLVLVPEHADAEGGLNLGNKVTNDLKVHLKIARSVGVHVSPTVYVDGVVENSISSSFSGEQWEEFLSKTVQ